MGTPWPWTSTRPSPQASATWSWARAITSADSGSGSPSTGMAEITATVVSLRPKTSAIQRSMRKQSAGFSSPQPAWGKPRPKAPPLPSGYSRKWVWTSITGSPLPSTEVATSGSVVASSGTS